MKLEEELKMKNFASPFHRATLSILYTANWINEHINATLKPFGISEQQFNVLRILRGQKDKTVNLLTIQERMIHKMSNATRLVEKLRLKGYVKRETCADNRRKVDICITEKGLKLLEELDVLMKKNESKLFKNITQKDAELLGKIMDKIRS